MRTERVFLMELFLDDELPKNIKIKIKERFEEMEVDGPKFMRPDPNYEVRAFTGGAEHGAVQSPSMQRLMNQNPDLIPKPPQPVTPAAAQALAQRQALLNSAGKEKPEGGRTSPRKI
jgi:hypothetical protein